MKKDHSLNGHSILYMLLAILAIVMAFKIAPLAYRHEPLILGFLSAVALYFEYFLFLSGKSSLVRKYMGVQVEIPRDIKQIVIIFFIFLITFWSLGYIINAIKYIYNLIR